MIDKTYVIAMANYNAWQNESLYRCASELNGAARRSDRGAFFKSIHATLNHILWADMSWMHRFAGTPAPEVGPAGSTTMYEKFSALKAKRAEVDGVIQKWAADLDPDWLKGDLHWYSGLLKKDVSKAKWVLVTHFFNHQTHHRGQAHAMLTAAGTKPDDTDLMLMDI